VEREISSSHTRFIDGTQEEYPSLQPAGDCYKKLFMEDDGDCYNIRKMSEAALIFDPIELRKLSDADIVTVNRYRADQLGFFRYRHFTDKFMKALKKEMPALVHRLRGIMIWVGFLCQMSTRLGCKTELGEISPRQ
jgi:hypothetical protein